jgi:hypothetical protein
MDPQDVVRQAIEGRQGTMNPLPTGIFQKEGKQFAGFHVSRGVGNFVENTPRFQSFLMDYDDIYKQQGRIMGEISNDGIEAANRSAIDYAALESKKWFMDYADLSDFEKNVMSKIIPFYSWIRKNLSNQISGIVMYPGMYGMVPKLEDFVKYKDGNYDETLVPEYMRQLGFFPVSKRDRDTYRMFNPNIPLQDLARIPLVWEEDEGIGLPSLSWQELKDDMISAAHPMIKNLVEVVIPEKGYDVWKKRELDRRAQAPYLLQMFTKTPEVLGFMDTALRMAGVENGLDIEVDKDGKLKMNAKLMQLMNTSMPVLRTIENVFQTGEVLIPGLDDAITKAFGAKSDYDRAETLLRAMSWNLGIKRSDIDIDEQGEWLQYDINRRARELAQEAEKDVVRFRTTSNRDARRFR